MKANKLMIGDYARVNRDGLCIKKGSIVVIRGIDADDKLEVKCLVGAAHCHPLDEKQFDGGIWCDYLDPIPLTPEILEKNGFEKCNEDTDGAIQYEFGSENLGIDIWVSSSMTESCLLGAWNKWPDCTELYDMITEMPIHYVHELQHALRLCEIKKEIVL